MGLTVQCGTRSYDVTVSAGCLSRAGELLNLDRRVLILTDDHVPVEYLRTLRDQCRTPYPVVIPMGEGSKSLQSFERILRTMLDGGFTRRDCVVALGGGVVGDLAGFAASAYMRGVDFYNIPTTLLSMVDSSIGGKTGVNFGGIKNIVGAFYQPKRVLIDPNTLRTLPGRHIRNGLAEAVKMAACLDADFFSWLEQAGSNPDDERVILGALQLKKQVVERDETEQGLRKVLNFGHTLGHGIESLGLGLFHGECVALGMLPMCGPKCRERLKAVLEGLELPTTCSFDVQAAYQAVLHDKKSDDRGVDIVTLPEIGRFEIRHADYPVLLEKLKQIEVNTP